MCSVETAVFSITIIISFLYIGALKRNRGIKYNSYHWDYGTNSTNRLITKAWAIFFLKMFISWKVNEVKLKKKFCSFSKSHRKDCYCFNFSISINIKKRVVTVSTGISFELSIKNSNNLSFNQHFEGNLLSWPIIVGRLLFFMRLYQMRNFHIMLFKNQFRNYKWENNLFSAPQKLSFQSYTLSS